MAEKWVTEGTVNTCKECFEDYSPPQGSFDDGFCSDSCYKKFNNTDDFDLYDL